MNLRNILYLVMISIVFGFLFLGFIMVNNSQKLNDAHMRVESYNNIIVHAIKVAILSHEYVNNPNERIDYQLSKRLELLESNTLNSNKINTKVNLLKRSLNKIKNKENLDKKILHQRLLGKIKLFSNQIILELLYQVRLLNEEMSSLHKNTEKITWIISFLTILIAVSLLIFLMKKIIYPIELISQGIKKIREGDFSYQTKIDSNMLKEFKKLILSVNETSNDLENSVLLAEKKKKELETIFNEVPSPMIIHNEDGEIMMMNKSWEEASEFSYAEINTIDKWVKNVLIEGQNERKEYINGLYSIEHRVNEGEFLVITKSGKKLTWLVNSAPLGIRDGKRVLITSAMDVTELKKKDELMIVQSRHAAMGEMIGMIAHQWRQPLTVISMSTNHMLLDIAMDELDIVNVKEYSNDILAQTEHLSKTIDDFRNFFRPDKSIMKTKVKEIMTETSEIVKDSLRVNNIELKLSYNSEFKVDAYPRELMQVFVNIINNAKDALLLKEGDDLQIDIRIYEDDKYVITEICDNGTGIDEAILDKIFDPYFTTKGEKTGTGLGLYMSKMIIEDHLYGKIEAYNQNTGMCFRVKLRKESNASITNTIS